MGATGHAEMHLIPCVDRSTRQPFNQRGARHLKAGCSPNDAQPPPNAGFLLWEFVNKNKYSFALRHTTCPSNGPRQRDLACDDTKNRAPPSLTLDSAGLLPAGQQGQKRGLARAVLPHNAHLRVTRVGLHDNRHLVKRVQVGLHMVETPGVKFHS